MNLVAELETRAREILSDSGKILVHPSYPQVPIWPAFTNAGVVRRPIR